MSSMSHKQMTSDDSQWYRTSNPSPLPESAVSVSKVHLNLISAAPIWKMMMVFVSTSCEIKDATKRDPQFEFRSWSRIFANAKDQANHTDWGVVVLSTIEYLRTTNFYPSPPSFGQSHPLPSSFTRHRSALPATTQLCPPSTRPHHRHPALSTVHPDYPPVTHRNRPLPTTTTFADRNRLLPTATDFCPPQPTFAHHNQLLPVMVHFCPPQPTFPPHKGLLPTATDFCPSQPTFAHHNQLLPAMADFCPPQPTFTPHNRLLPTTTDFCPPQPTFARHNRLLPTTTNFFPPWLTFAHHYLPLPPQATFAGRN
ncbi:hypothetical protein BYT27DRAFT_7247764 [Phlegmacium glaucopus]|nr:hypothetical protein BYT27DRAFT_7247764 [Phlegmacium glaucopus]